MNRRVRRAAAAALCLSMLLAAGCNNGGDPGAATVTRTEAPTAVPATPVITIEWRQPVGVASRARDFGGGYIVYPSITGGAWNTVNSGIFTTVKSYVEAMDAELYSEYTVKTNDRGLFSCIMYLLDNETYELLDFIVLNYDCETGNVCQLGSFFDPDNDGWRYLIPDYVLAEAEAEGITLLSEPEPPSDTQAYYIEDGCIVFVYHIFELATYSAGIPQLRVPIADLEEYLAEDSILRRFITEAQ